MGTVQYLGISYVHLWSRVAVDHWRRHLGRAGPRDVTAEYTNNMMHCLIMYITFVPYVHLY